MIPLTEGYFSEGILIGKYTLTGTMISAMNALLSYRLSMLKSVYTKRLYAYANLLTDKHLQVRRCQTFRFPSRRPQRYLPVSVREGADCYLHLLLSLAQYVPRNAL